MAAHQGGFPLSEAEWAQGPWRGLEDVEFATLEWVAWFNASRLLEPLSCLPAAEYEEPYHRLQAAPAAAGALE